jgi:hypothetical protein
MLQFSPFRKLRAHSTVQEESHRRVEDELRLVKNKYEAIEQDLKREREEAWSKEIKAGKTKKSAGIRSCTPC